jgi:hypothetical protein
VNESLRLEYICTPAEIEEAQTLGLQQKLGGSKLLTMVVLLLMLTAVGPVMYLGVRQLPGGLGVSVVAVAILSAIVLLVIQRCVKKPRAPTTVEIDSGGLCFAMASARSTMRWSEFSDLWESDKLFVLRQHGGILVFVLPKRAFPDEHACDWFRTLANVSIATHTDTAADTRTESSTPLAATEDGTVIIEFKLRYRDYLDRSLASWFVRGMMVGAAGLVLGVFLVDSFKPQPGAVYSEWQVFLFFGLPFLTVTECIVLLVATTHTWAAHVPSLRRQTVTLSDAGLTDTAGGANARLTWETPTRFKETPWSFIIWWPGTSAWTQIPKRSFLSPTDVDRCRQILAEHATPSSWFRG